MDVFDKIDRQNVQNSKQMYTLLPTILPTLHPLDYLIT